MKDCYFELRKTSKEGDINLAADMMRHLYTRQYLGKTIIICQRPAIFLSAAHKQWLRLSRTIQRQRASTLNADKILKYTRTITHMQHLRFAAKSPIEYPEGDVFFVHETNLDIIPLKCLNVYCTTDVDVENIVKLIDQLPSDALLIDYDQTNHWHEFGLKPKRELEACVLEEWEEVQTFLKSYDINPVMLSIENNSNTNTMDDALDTLLGISDQFLRIANHFNRTLELARPLRITKAMRSKYDMFVLLAHRVQALSAGDFTQRFLEVYSEDDTFFLYDAKKYFLRNSSGESLLELIKRHRDAGRIHLVQALRP